jgi:membrane-associated phospholipid phosphatase
MTALTIVGGGWAVVALLPLALWARTRRLAVGLSAAIITQASVVWLLKLAIGRVRPWLALGLPAPLGTPHDGSFPSGHAAGSFCVAAFFLAALPGLTHVSSFRARVLSLLGVVGAALVSLSRVYLGAHFPSDVVAGALIGALVGARAGSRYARRPVGSGDNIRGERRPLGLDARARGAREVECPSKRR